MAEDDWGDEIDDIIKNIKTQRYFANHVDPTFQTHFCERCGQPTSKYSERIDSAGNIEEQKDDLCGRCLKIVIQNTAVGCDEQNPR